uniref:Protein HIRA n=1 Tax=Clastoptera arizonana TaxID=38151 RepID=A0A1B6BYQ8_9HEMI
MQLLKPAWVSHDEMPIFSIDIHPDGSRFATGGQGVGSGRVVIWNMAPITSLEAENNEKVPKILCQLDNHLACVNCVRWSYSGKNLATAGDDKVIMIWMFAKSPTGGSVVFGGKGQVNIETWRCVSTLRGHHGDVLDMAWSPQDTWLASCSIDNTVIVWNATKFPEMVVVLKGHTGLVKGVTWDPVGKYLSSQADDKSIIIWRTVDWQQEAIIKEPFKECAGTTLVLRLSWSPDGQYLVSAHAMNGSGPTAQVIEREGWRHEIDFVGHRKAVTCVRFNTNIFCNKILGKSMQACCLAIGSRDRSISVWMTALKRPLFVLSKLFSRPVLDISWSANGYQLMACSGDGTVAFLEFSEQELGKALTLEEKSALYEKIYGKSLVYAQTSSAMVLENHVLLRTDVKVKTPEPIVENKPSPSKHQNNLVKPITNKQIETRTSDGRRRITPISVPLTPDTGEGPTPFGSETSPFSSSSESKSQIVIERREDVVVIPNVSIKNASSAGISTNSTRNCMETNQLKTSTVSERSLIVDKGNLDKTLAGNSKKPRFTEKKISTVENGQSIIARRVNETDQQTDAINLPLMRLSVPYTCLVPSSKKTIIIQNDVITSPHGTLTIVKMKNLTEVKWTVVLGSAVCSTSVNSILVALGCEDGSIHVLKLDTGSHLIPSIVLSRPSTQITLGSSFVLMSLTTNGFINVWDLVALKAIGTNISVEPIMISSNGLTVSITKCWMSEEAMPLVALSSGKAFMYSYQMLTWLKIRDNLDPVVRNSEKSIQTAWKNVPDSHCPLKNIESLIQDRLVTCSRIMPNYENSALCTSSYLDHQLSACKALNSSQEYRFWLIQSVKYYLQEGNESKLRLICEELLGPIHNLNCNELGEWETSILGLEKRNLLKDVLTEMSSSLHVQRLYSEYTEQLNILNTRI